MLQLGTKRGPNGLLEVINELGEAREEWHEDYTLYVEAKKKEMYMQRLTRDLSGIDRERRIVLTEEQLKASDLDAATSNSANEEVLIMLIESMPKDIIELWKFHLTVPGVKAGYLHLKYYSGVEVLQEFTSLGDLVNIIKDIVKYDN